MKSTEISADVIFRPITRAERRKAAVHLADRIAAEHPQLTAEQIAADPLLAQGLRELLDAVLGHDIPRRNP